LVNVVEMSTISRLWNGCRWARTLWETWVCKRWPLDSGGAGSKHRKLFVVDSTVKQL
jgi:hypothetical protein